MYSSGYRAWTGLHYSFMGVIGCQSKSLVMKKFLLTVAASMVGVVAFCQMGPWAPIGATGVPSPDRSGYTDGINIHNGTAYVICIANPRHDCVRTVQGLAGKSGMEVFDKDEKSLGKFSYSEGRYRTEPGKTTEIELKDAVKF